ncbi:MAG: EamA family transporter [Acidimicrobiales bacterium]
MAAILLALAAACGWGASDFAAGRASRSASVVSVVIVTHFVAVVAMVAVAIRWPHFSVAVVHADEQWLSVRLGLGAPSLAGEPLFGDLVWGGAAGVSGGLGAALLFRGLSRGATALVAPITAVGGAFVPLVWSVATGSTLSPLAVVGLALGLVAILLVSMTGAELSPQAVADELPTLAAGHHAQAPAITARVNPALPSPPRHNQAAPSGFGDAPLHWGSVPSSSGNVALAPSKAPSRSGSGSGSGSVSSGSPGSATVPSSGGTLPGGPIRRRSLVLRRPGLGEALLSGVGFGFFFVLISRSSPDAGLWPMVAARAASVLLFACAAWGTRRAVLPKPGSRRAAALAGVLDGAAAGLFLSATHAGVLPMVVVLTSLYPAITLLAARVVTKELLGRRQIAGLVVAAVAVSLLALAR